ncbi:31523_t:CDS:1, partial [Gigaspora margarita]
NNCAFNNTHLENYNTNTVIPYNIGHMNLECSKYKALHWLQENVAGSKQTLIFSTCCAKSKVQLPVTALLPTILFILLVEKNEQARAFRKKIQMYNSALAFTSIGTKINEHVINQQRVYNFHIYGELYHHI